MSAKFAKKIQYKTTIKEKFNVKIFIRCETLCVLCVLCGKTLCKTPLRTTLIRTINSTHNFKPPTSAGIFISQNTKPITKKSY